MKVDENCRKLKIALVLDRFLPSRGGEGYFSWLAGELTKRGHEVHVFASAVEDTPGRQYALHRVRVLGYPRSLRILTFLLRVGRTVESFGFDIVHGVGQTLAMNVFNPHGGVEKAYVERDFSSLTNTNRYYYLYRYLRRYLSVRHHLTLWIQKKQYLSEGVKKIIAISNMVKEDMIRHYGVPEGKIAVVLNCVDMERFHPRNRAAFRKTKRRDLRIDDETIVLLFAGNNYRLKGLAPLLGALVHLRRRFPQQPFRLLIVGRGRIRPYRRLARRLGVADLVVFLGPVDGMEHYYAASDIYVHPSFYDSCSLTVLEALASGLPVVTSRFNGASDAILSDRGGKVLADPSDERELARSIALYFDRNRRDEARIVTRQWMERHSPASNVEKTLRIYYEAVREG